MSANKRKSDRKKIQLTTFIRKERPAGGYSLMQFVSRDLSEGGVFICTDDLSLFDLGEKISVLVDKNRNRLYEGNATVVRSARVYSTSDELTDSGFGIMFTGTGPEFDAMVMDQLATAYDGEG